MLTRAMSLLIVIGDPITLARDYHWRAFIKYCIENEAISILRQDRRELEETIQEFDRLQGPAPAMTVAPK